MFAPLNTKTTYSFLDSLVKIEDYLDRAKSLGYTTVGICDNDNLHAAYRFILAAQKRQLRPVVSYETSLRFGISASKISFIALSTQGYYNLLKLSTRIREGKREFSDLSDLMEGLAIVLPQGFEDLQQELGEAAYIGLELGETTSGKSIAFPSVRYLDNADQEALEVLRSIRSGLPLAENIHAEANELLVSPAQYERLFSASKTALSNLSSLTEKIYYELEEHLTLPIFDQKTPSVQLLTEKAERGLSSRLLNSKPSKVKNVYQDRLSHELSVIHQMGFDDYFLIVAELLDYARKQKIYCGMGRGSAAGSLVAYSLGITQVDPIENNLLFERFLNPERLAMPDIDIDMPDNRRAELLAHMQTRYGRDHVAQIVTFSTFGKRQAIRDTAKAYGMTEPEINRLSKLLSGRFGKLTDEYENNQRFRAEVMQSEKIRQIFQTAQRLEGLPRQTSIHASGVVLAERALYHYLPLAPSDELLISQYEAHDVEAIGLLKIDFLGLRNLSLIEEMQQVVKKKKQMDIDPLEIDLEDAATLALFREGNTLGIFQFENPQMRQFLRRLMPTCFNDLVDATSIFRPGPSQFIPQFVARRHGKEKWESLDPVLNQILEPTYGIIIYQEQVMLTAVEYSGFSMGAADSLRRAISKKEGRAFEALKTAFIDGAVQKGHSKEQAQSIYDLIERFANYGFNRSHAYAYAALAFQIAYYKANYPDEFYEVQLKNYKRESMLSDALQNGYQLVEMAINRTPYHDKLSNGQLSLGLSHIAGFPTDYALWIVENRPFANLTDFISRTPENFQKEEFIRNLTLIGAFDAFESNRGKILKNLPRLIAYHQNLQLDLFSGKSQLSFNFEEAEDLNPSEKYEQERELLGVSISAHPISEWEKKLAGSYRSLSNLTEGTSQSILVELIRIRSLNTKKNERMAFVEASDNRQKITLVFFPEDYRSNLTKLEAGSLCLVTGKVEFKEGEPQILARQVIPLFETDERLWLSVLDDSFNEKIANLLRKHPGPYRVVLRNESEKITRTTQFYVEKSDFLLKQLVKLASQSIYQ